MDKSLTDPTPREMRLLRALVRFIDTYRCPPTEAELAEEAGGEAAGFKSRGSVGVTVRAMLDKGLVEHRGPAYRIHRALYPTERGERIARQKMSDEEEPA